MNTKVTKILTWLMALIIFVSVEALPVSAEEFFVEEETIMGGIEINVPVGPNVEVARNLVGEEFNVGLNGNEISLYADGGIQTADEGQESILRYGSASGYLAETGAFQLYSINLSAGDYLQARLTVPNNAAIMYALAFYDSELNVIKVGSSRVMVGKKYPQPQCLC